ncbi:unnamed protein product [Leptidea sinapis]|uniref:RETREG1-3/ARL6IP-like N-terminal reticulon-homology domain-containing protein n=1 Tax=Leptidea sinapis TaxID=189913 RepID=A0A5E4QIR5_9NEOP|nr:unnamed protein product [Leptidea sinapis]
MISDINQDLQVKKLKKFLEGWRLALVPLNSVLLWEQHWHPCAIIATASVIYFIIWLIDMSTLATFAIIGSLINLIDFVVPIISNSICKPDSWTGQNEKIFEDICKNIVSNYNLTWEKINNFYSMRGNSPIMYYIISISMLCVLAWMASSINNVFLLYLFTTVLLLWPGIQHKGIFNTLLSMIHMAPKKAMKSE